MSNLEILRGGTCQLTLEIYKKTDPLSLYILSISEHTFGNCALTLTSLMLSGILSHTLIPTLGHFQFILLHKLLSLFF